MRTRSAGRIIILGGFVLAALVAGIACSDNGSPASNGLAGPTSVTSSASAGLLATSAVVTCSARLSHPGDTCQATMILAFADGSTRDVTAEARWGYGGAITISPGGLVTARSYGVGQIIHNAYRELGLNPIPVRVLPEGSFIVTGRVAEGGVKVVDAWVSARSASGTATTTSSDDGSYTLAPVSGDAVIRVDREGYASQERKVSVQHDDVANFDVVRSGSGTGIEGVYSLTFTAAPSCALPAEFVRRTYLARINEKADGLLVELDGPGLPGDGWYLYGFRGQRDGSAVRFDIHGTPNDPVADYDYIFTEALDGFCSMLQPCGGVHRFLSFKGTAAGSIEDRSIPTVFSGTVLLYTGTGTLAQCSGDHRLEFTR